MMLLLPTDPYSVRDTTVGGKFDTGLTEALYEMMLDGFTPGVDFVGDENTSEGAELFEMPDTWGLTDTWCIVSWDSRGFVYSKTYPTREAADEDWSKVLDAYADPDDMLWDDNDDLRPEFFGL